MKTKVQRKNLKSNVKLYKQKKGITLIALVVTIVVLLILAGVSINLVLNNNGIISKAKDAKNQYAEAQTNDEKQLNEVADWISAEVGETTGGGTGSDTKVPEAATAETAPYFPDNTFTKKEGTIDKGLVIQDSVGNEYVWVVVPKTLYNNTSYNSNGAKKPTSSEDYSNIEYCLQQYTSTYRKGTSYSDTYYADTANEGWFADKTEYNTAKNKMLKSVYENGGFYVGRYEAGIATTGTNRKSNTDKNADGKYTVTDTMPTPITQANAYPYTGVTRTQAQKLAEKVNSGNRTSSLMFGVQWDLVLAFMAKDTTKITDTSILTSNSTTIGNYRDSAFKLRENGKYAVFTNYTLRTWNPATTATTNFVDSSLNKISQNTNENGILVTTGTSEQNKVMNIYDIAGNVNEWTLEKTSYAVSPCAYRGGGCNYTGSDIPASSRGSSSTTGSFDLIGFRVSLY